MTATAFRGCRGGAHVGALVHAYTGGDVLYRRPGWDNVVRFFGQQLPTASSEGRRAP